MKDGDISNQFAPAIVIDVDDLIVKIEKPKNIFQRKKIELIPGVSGWLHRIFSTEYSIYIVCIRESKKEAVQIEEFIDEMMIPYSRFIKLTDSRSLHNILELPHITTYYYRDMTHSPPLGTVNKAVRVESILEGI